MTEKSAPPRPSYPVVVAEAVVGTVVSGTQSPTLNAGLGMAYVPPSSPPREPPFKSKSEVNGLPPKWSRNPSIARPSPV